MSIQCIVESCKLRNGNMTISIQNLGDKSIRYELWEESREVHIPLRDEQPLGVDMKDEAIVGGTYKLVAICEGERVEAVPAPSYTTENGMIDLSANEVDPTTNYHFIPAVKQGKWVIRKWKTSADAIHKKAVYLSTMKADGYDLEGTIDYPFKKTIRQAEVWIWAKGLQRLVRIPQDAAEVQAGHIHFSMKEFMNTQFDSDGRLWEICLVLNLEGGYHILRMEQGSNRKFATRRKKAMEEGKYWIVDRWDKKLDESERSLQAKPLEQARIFHTYFNNEGQLSAKVIERDQLYLQYIHEKVVSITIQKGIARIEIEVIHPEFDFKKMVFQSLHDEELSYEMSLVNQWEQDGKQHILWEQDIKQIEWHAYSWGFFLYGEKSGIEYLIRPINVEPEFRKSIYHRRRNMYRQGKLCVFPYITQNDYPVLFCREHNRYDGAFFWLKEQIACIWYHYRNQSYENRNIVLSYEKFGQMAQDNSYYMFQYLMESDEVSDSIRKDCYYIIDKKAKDYAKLKKYHRNVVAFGSIRHLVYLQAAKVYLAIDSKRHAYPWRAGNSRILDRMERIPFYFLQHGVLGMKRVEYIYGKGTVNEATCMVASSDKEKQMITRYFGYDDYQVVVSGLARWDVLKDRSKDTEKTEILLMPTWRNWLQEVDEETFLSSDYFLNYKELLTNAKLIQFLEEKNCRLIFCMHPKFRDFMSHYEVASSNIELYAYGNVPINELLMRCQMMITDYSSASWDVFRMGKPIIFYQFDYTRYIEEQGSYFDMETELFGDRVLDSDTLVQTLIAQEKRGYKEKDEYRDLRDTYFAHTEGEVRSKIYQVLKERFLS